MKKLITTSPGRFFSGFSWIAWANILVYSACVCVLVNISSEAESAKALESAIATLKSTLVSKTSAPSPQRVIPLPPSEVRYLNDVSEILELANVVGLPISSVAYQEQELVGSYAIRSMEIKTLEAYPRIKLFSAQVLAALPNVNLSHMRLDRKEEPPHLVAATLRFVMVYQVSTQSPVRAQVQGDRQ